MLKSILNLEGAKLLGREEKKQISGGDPFSVCASLGAPCDPNIGGFPIIPCLGDVDPLCCTFNTWTDCPL